MAQGKYSVTFDDLTNDQLDTFEDELYKALTSAKLPGTCIDVSEEDREPDDEDKEKEE